MLKTDDIIKLKEPFLVIGVLLVWTFFILAGTYQLLAYEYTPGGDTNFPETWPSSTGLKLGAETYTLIMLIHPKCSCSRASIGELSKLLAHSPHLLHAKVLFEIPKNAGPDWTQSENWTAAKKLPGTEMVHDIDGNLARLFNVRTSGFTLLYDREGKLVFHGGITASRGHWGDNAGSRAISDIVTKGSSAVKETAAFGCNLFKK